MGRVHEDVDMLQTYLNELLGVVCHYIHPFLCLLIFHRIIKWIALWESISSHNITGLLLEFFRIFRTPY